jgi:hypothetical protein
MSEREFRRPLLKIIRDFKEDANKQINEVRKSTQNLDKKSAPLKRYLAKKLQKVIK